MKKDISKNKLLSFVFLVIFLSILVNISRPNSIFAVQTSIDDSSSRSMESLVIKNIEQIKTDSNIVKTKVDLNPPKSTINLNSATTKSIILNDASKQKGNTNTTQEGVSSSSSEEVGGIPLNAGSFTAPNDNILNLYERVKILEESKKDIEIWIEIFVASASILILLNIGLSVWQVGSIARKEVEERIQNYDKKLNGLLTIGTEAIDDKLNKYNKQFDELNDKLADLRKILERNRDHDKDIYDYVDHEIDYAISKIELEGNTIKETILTELTHSHEEQILKFENKMKKLIDKQEKLKSK